MELPPSRFDEILRQLSDTPENVQLRHFLATRRCKVFATENLSVADAVVIQADSAPDEPNGFGRNAGALYRLLNKASGWFCVLTDDDTAPKIAALMQADGYATSFYGDVTLALEQPSAIFEHPGVRLLSPDDLPLLAKASPELRGAAVMVGVGIVAAGIANGRIVSIAHTYAMTEGFADVGVYTDESERGQGFSTAAVSLVCRELQKRGLTPVWSCGERNAASLRVAAKIGFERRSTKTYVIRK